MKKPWERIDELEQQLAQVPEERRVMSQVRRVLEQDVVHKKRVKTDRPPDDLKSRVNDLLWTTLPGGTSLDEAESIACDICRMIVDQWEDDQ